jgi:transcriptional regulator with XRE-family HTH domain
MVSSIVGSRAAFGTYLRELRKRKGVKSPAELARRMGQAISVSGILKRERGELKITQDYVDAFARAVLVTAEEEKYLRKHLSLFRLQFDLWRAGKSILDINVEAAARLEESNNIQCFSPTLIPHILQTPAYGRAILETYRSCESKEELEQTVVVRGRSAARIQREAHYVVRLVNWEAALYNIYGGPLVMMEQLARLSKGFDSGHVQYRILPLGTLINMPTDSTFTIHDGLFVTAESTVGNLYTGDKEKAVWASENFARLWNAAVFGQKRQELIERAITHMKKAL